MTQKYKFFKVLRREISGVQVVYELKTFGDADERKWLEHFKIMSGKRICKLLCRWVEFRWQKPSDKKSWGMITTMMMMMIVVVVVVVVHGHFQQQHRK
jgi:hypothetical protein